MSFLNRDAVFKRKQKHEKRQYKQDKKQLRVESFISELPLMQLYSDIDEYILKLQTANLLSN